MEEESSLIISGSELKGLMKESLEEALKKNRLKTRDDTSMYVAQLLVDFTVSDRLFGKEGSVDDLFEESEQGILTAMYGRAAELPKSQKVKAYMHLGDYILFVSGFYPDVLKRHAADLSYCQQIGSSSYWQLADIFDGGVYEELSGKFKGISNTLQILSVRFTGGTEREIISLYRRYLLTGRPHMKERLEELGIKLPSKD